MDRLVLTFLLMVPASIEIVRGQESAQYLQSVIRDLRNMKNRQTLKRVNPELVDTYTTQPPPTSTQQADRRIQNNNSKNNGAPALSLTKGELAALYQAAVAKGETVNLKSGDNSYIHAAVHEISDSGNSDSGHNNDIKLTDGNKGEADASGGYYYYYYPIKSFLDEMSSQTQTAAPDRYKADPSSHHEEYHYDHSPAETEKTHFQYHSHTHQHNVKITKEPEEKKSKKALEPLFMAISGFIGMAVMFVLSVLVFPKFGIKKSASLKKNEQHISDIARVALQAIEGRDCSERFACELEKTARTFKVQDNRFVKLLKRMAPGTFGKEGHGKFNSPKRLRCTAIPCKKKAAVSKSPTKVPAKKKKSGRSEKKD